MTDGDTLLDGYARWAARIAERVGGTDVERLAYLGLGLASEAGELADQLKRLIRDGAAQADAFADELGDILYYWAALCDAAGRRPSEVLARSREKVEARLAERARW
jgi:NTP pyrophosphatase (non-canonical NTP hydrolase)